MVDKKDIEKLAHLARLKVDEIQAEEFAQQLSKILDYFKDIAEVPTQNIEPLVTPSDMEAYWREDEAHQDLSADEMLSNAPDRVGRLLKVPPVV